MSVLVLLVLVGGAFALCFWNDARGIAELAAERGWRELRIAWAPFAGFWTGNRHERKYWLRYRDEDGRDARRLCKVVGLFQGSAGVCLEPVETPGSTLRLPRLNRAGRTLVGAGAGAFAGCALGIALCLVIFPGSNIAPAYGVILGTPLGLLVGALLGARRG